MHILTAIGALIIILLVLIVLFIHSYSADLKKTAKPADPPKPDNPTPEPVTNQTQSSLLQDIRNYFQNLAQNIQDYPIIGAFITYYFVRFFMGKDFANKMMVDFFQKNP